MQTTGQSIPHRIGRYDIVGRIATGGMAEILLGRLTGPSGFERPLVIKRILPHLARQHTFVNMFLDEGRIAASVRHPNVVLHEELGRDGEELFLVMEYLDGETLGSVLRRGRARGRPLDRGLSAYIVASACAGLHAAHQLIDADGQLQGLVHRDVSPHNVFVTYGGSVKLMDFGIAKVANRITSTDVGTVKGKFAYMSPEQARGEPLDRRSDIFSMGIVLYELTMEHALFRRRNQAATLRAVLKHDVSHLRTLDPSYPALLKQVCFRALSPNPADRYDSALDMRRDLLEAMRDMGCDAMPEEALVAYLAGLFQDRIESKRQMLRRFREGEVIPSFPSPEVDESVDLPMDQAQGSDIAETTPIATDSVPQHKRSRVTAIAVASLLFGAAVIGAFAISINQDTSRTSAVGSVSLPVPPPMARDTTAPQEPVLSQRVIVTVSSTPEGAEVLIGDRLLGVTPFELTLPRSEVAVEVTLRKAGFFSVVERVVPSVDQRVSVHLPEVAPRRTKRRPQPERTGGVTPNKRRFHRFD